MSMHRHTDVSCSQVDRLLLLVADIQQFLQLIEPAGAHAMTGSGRSGGRGCAAGGRSMRAVSRPILDAHCKHGRWGTSSPCGAL